MSLINETTEYVSIDGKCLVHVERDLVGLTPSPRETTDANVGTFLTWHRCYKSPDENRWDSAADWIADMLDERLSDRELLNAAASGRIDGVRVVDHDGCDYDCDGPMKVVQSWVTSPWRPVEPFWNDEIILDSRDLEIIEEGCDWCGDALAEAIAPRPEAVELLRESGMVVLPVYMLDHTGICYSTSDFNDPWDSGLVGFISTTRERVSELFGEGYPVTCEMVVDALKTEDGELLVSHGPYCERDFGMYDADLISDIVGFEVRTEAARAA